MKIEIKKVQDVKTFEPFKCELTFENKAQVNLFLDDFNYLHEALEGEFEEALTMLLPIETAVNIEMKKQGLL